MGENNRFDLKKELILWVKALGWAIVIAIILKLFVFNIATVSGSSMYPTLENKDKLIFEKISLYFRDPKKGDIVILKAPDNDVREGIIKNFDYNTIDKILNNDLLRDFIVKDYVKRVIATEGDTVSIVDGIVYVNNEKLEENYVVDNAYTETVNDHNWVVGSGEVFVLGDNREPNASKDSRSFGLIKTDSIKGISNFRLYPLNSKFGIISNK